MFAQFSGHNAWHGTNFLHCIEMGHETWFWSSTWHQSSLVLCCCSSHKEFIYQYLCARNSLSHEAHVHEGLHHFFCVFFCSCWMRGAFCHVFVSISIGMFYNLFVILISFLPIFVEHHISFGILCHFFKSFLSLSFWVVQFVNTTKWRCIVLKVKGPMLQLL